MRISDVMQTSGILADPKKFTASIDSEEVRQAVSDNVENFVSGGARNVPAKAEQYVLDVLQGYVPESGRKRRLNAHTQEYLVKQSMYTTDFPNIFATVLDRSLEAAYQASLNSGMRQLVRTRTGNDFRTRDRYSLSGGQALLEKVGKHSEVRERDKMSETKYSYNVEVYGKIHSTSFQDMIDDAGDLDIFSRIPENMAIAARATEEKALTELMVDSSGWLTSVFDLSGQVDNIPLTPDNLITGYNYMLDFTTPTDAHPMMNIPRYLVVPPKLALQAQNILRAAERISSATTGDVSANKTNLINLEIIVNPWLPVVASSGTVGDTAWGLFADPNTTQAGTPIAEFGLLRGYERPTLYAKTPNQELLGGGAVPSSLGDFNTHSIQWKVLHIFGSVAMEARNAYTSNGQ